MHKGGEAAGGEGDGRLDQADGVGVVLQLLLPRPGLLHHPHHHQAHHHHTEPGCDERRRLVQQEMETVLLKWIIF